MFLTYILAPIPLLISFTYVVFTKTNMFSYLMEIEWVNNVVTNASYNCIYYYSKAQIYYNKWVRYLETYPVLNEVHKRFFNGTPSTVRGSRTEPEPETETRFRYSLLQIIQNGKSVIPGGYDNTVDFVILSAENKDTNCRDNLIRYVNKRNENHINNEYVSENETDHEQYNINTEEPYVTQEEMIKIFNNTSHSSVKFIMVEASLDSNNAEIFTIDLKTPEYNYYLVTNELRKEFFVYYLNHYYHLEDVDNNTGLRVKIIDQNANILYLDYVTENKRIVFNEDDYEII